MRLYVARRKNRIGLVLPMGQVSSNPTLLFPLLRKLDASELEEQIRIQLNKLGITQESDVQAILEKAEADYEFRIKVAEAQREIKRLMDLRRQGAKLMSIGRKKWAQVFYPAVLKKED